MGHPVRCFLEHRVIGIQPFIAGVLVEARGHFVVEGADEPGAARYIDHFNLNFDILAIGFDDAPQDIKIARGVAVRCHAHGTEHTRFLERLFQFHCEPIRLRPAQFRPHALFLVVARRIGQAGIEHRHDHVQARLRGVDLRRSLGVEQRRQLRANIRATGARPSAARADIPIGHAGCERETRTQAVDTHLAE